ncbi:MAG: hypothetical protein WC584_00180 [Candidatus Pacearchaeota archaeon]
MESEQQTAESLKKEKFNFGKFHDKYYKLFLLVPIIILIISLVYLFSFYSRTGDFIIRDVSLSGGTTITLKGDIDSTNLELGLEEEFPGISFNKLTDLTTRKPIALVIQSSSSIEELKPEIEKILGYSLNDENSSIEFTGSSLSKDFYRQLIFALVISFILMSLVIFILFRTFIPSIAVIFSVFADIVMPLALIDYFGMKISAAGIAAFLMLVGYSVDTDILLTTRVLKNSEGSLNFRIFRSFKTGILMTLTALAAVLPAFLLITALPNSFRQIFLILALGLLADILNTWVTNVSIIKWYCEKKGIQ